MIVESQYLCIRASRPGAVWKTGYEARPPQRAARSRGCRGRPSRHTMVAPGSRDTLGTDGGLLDEKSASTKLDPYPGEHAKQDAKRKWLEEANRRLRLAKLLDVMMGRRDSECAELLERVQDLSLLPELPVHHSSHESRKQLRIKLSHENARLQRAAVQHLSRRRSRRLPMQTGMLRDP